MTHGEELGKDYARGYEEGITEGKKEAARKIYSNLQDAAYFPFMDWDVLSVRWADIETAFDKFRKEDLE